MNLDSRRVGDRFRTLLAENAGRRIHSSLLGLAVNDRRGAVNKARPAEPTWGGFPCLAFRDGDTIELRSKAGKSLTRYFPDVVSALLKLKPQRFVLDGELVISVDGVLSFEHLLGRMNRSVKRAKELDDSILLYYSCSIFSWIAKELR